MRKTKHTTKIVMVLKKKTKYNVCFSLCGNGFAS
ncbi:unnamed protein product [Brassica rapa subsp. trilocularis]